YLNISICRRPALSRGEPLVPIEPPAMTTPTKNDRRLPPEALRWTCDPAGLGFTTTADLPRQAAIVGQARGVHALQFGLGIDQHGYNVFVSGPPGTGRSSYARAEVGRIAQAQPAPPDGCCV